MYFRIGNYEISVWLFVIAAVVIAGIAITLWLLLKKKDTGGSEIQKYKRITAWQRKNLNAIIEEDLKIYGESSGQDYISRGNKLQAYINRRREWNKEELLQLDETSVSYLTTVIIENVDVCIKNDKNNKAVLLLCALDYIYGGAPVLNGKLDWIGEDMPELKNHKEMSAYEARLLNIFREAVSEAWEYVDEELGKIPETTKIDDKLKEFSVDDFIDAYRRVENCVDIKELQGDALVIACRILNKRVSGFAKTMDKDGLKYYQMYYVRALACAAEKTYRMYDDILESLDYD